MKHIYNIELLLTTMLISTLGYGQNAWINEIHYDNTGTDVNEFVEVVIENPGAYNLADFVLSLENGGNLNAPSYGTHALSTFTVGTTTGNYTIYSKAISGIQNGAPDGLSLTYQGTLIQFISYEGSFTPTGGPLTGITSTDIGVLQSGSEAAGLSIQLSGTGSQYGDFTWTGPAAETPGNLNNSQTIQAATPDLTPPTFISTFPNVSNIVSDGFTLNAQLDEPGTLYYAVVANGTTAPTSAAVKTGTGFVTSGSSAVANAEETVSVAISGLTTSTVYDVYVVAEDDEGTPNLQAAPTAIQDVTPGADVVAPTLQAAGTGTGVAQSIILTFDEPIQATDATGFSISVNAATATINGFTVDGSTLILTIAEEIFVGDVVVLNYGAGNVQDVSGNDLGTITDQTVTNNATAFKVSNLTDLRALSIGSFVYLTGEVVLTHQRSSRNQKYVQDSGAGVLIDDSPGTITTVYSIGDGITGLRGTLGNFNGTLQLVPSANPGAATSNGNAITPLEVAVSDFAASPNTYESRVITLNKVRFATAGTNFDSGADSYTIEDENANTTTFRDNLTEGDYSGFPQPYGFQDIVGLGGDFNGAAQIIPYNQTAISDNYAPEFTSTPEEENASFFEVEISARIDEPGTVYYLVLPNGTGTPSIAEIKAGLSVTVENPASQGNITLSGLEENTSYDVYLLAVDDEATPNEQDSPTMITVTTVELVGDADSDIKASANPIEAATLMSVGVDFYDVFNFVIEDKGTADGLATVLSSAVIVPGTNNTADWETTLVSASLSRVGGGAVRLMNEPISGTITSSGITFDFSSANFSIEDGEEVELRLTIAFSETVVDGEVLEFEIPTTHSFTTDANGSAFGATVTGVVSNAHTIEVEATEFEISVSQSLPLNEVFSLSVSAVDANGNIDTDSRSISLSVETGGANISSATGLTGQAMNNGTYAWNDLIINASGDYTLTVTDGTLSTTTETLSVLEVTGSVFFSEYIEGTSNNKAIEIFNGKNVTIDLSNYMVRQSNNGAGFGTAASEPQAYDLQLSGELAPGDVLVIVNGQANPTLLAFADVSKSFGTGEGDRIVAFNGDDAMGLFENGVLIDLIGDPSVDPGSNWPVAGTGATNEFTLVRKSSVMQGNTTPLGSFGTNAEDSEWIVNTQDNFNYIGFHEMDEPSTEFLEVDVVTTSFNGDFGLQQEGTSSVATSFIINAAGLTENVLVTPPSSFEVSLSNTFGTVGTNSSPLSIAPSNGSVENVTIYARFAPTTEGAVSGDITISSTGFTNITLAVSGEGTPAPLGISDDLGISIYPNPNKGVFSIANDSGKMIRAELFSLEGARMPMMVKDSLFDISALKSGMYILVIQDDRGNQLGSTRIIKQ